MTFKIKSSIINLIMMIISLCLITAITSFLRLLSIKMPTPFLFRSFFVYHDLKPVFSTSLVFCPIHLVSWKHKIFTYLLIAVSTNYLSLFIMYPTFQLPKWILLSLISFLVTHTRRVKCENLYSFDTTSERRCSASLRW
jgi:hypothetical protein